MAKIDYGKIFLKGAVPTSIGGQAVLDGIMMQSAEKRAIGMRLPTGEILLKTEKKKKAPGAMKIPFVRGCVAFFLSLVDGMKVLTESADILEEYAPEEYNEEPSRFEQWLNRKFGPKAAWNFLVMAAVVFALIITIAVFIILPTVVVSLLKFVTTNSVVLNLVEGLLRILLFILYILAIRKMPEIQTLFQYHGAEHKTIHCFENGQELIPENAEKFYTLHPRCGTSFLVFVFIIALLLFSFLGWPSLFWRIFSRIVLLPVIAGISYELLKWAGRSDNAVVKILSYPGLMLQKLTTAEPDRKQLEVAIAALKAVLDDKEIEDGGELVFLNTKNREFENTIFRENFLDEISGIAPAAEPEAPVEEEPKESMHRIKGKRFSTDPGTVGHALKWGMDSLGLLNNGRNEARLIFSYLTGMRREEILLRESEMLPESVFEEYQKLVEERLTGKPLQYITKVQEFMGLPFKVNPSVLIPRLDTEVLAEKVLKLISESGWSEPEVLDLCCGSGALGITVAYEVPGAKVMLADIDNDTMGSAIANAQLNGVFDRCSFVIGDMFKAVPDDKKYDIIICNPPYIPTKEIEGLSVEVREHEPRKALDGGEDGLDFYRIIAEEAGAHIKEGGYLALEIGCEQADTVRNLLSRSEEYGRIGVIKDLAKLDRVVIAERRRV